VRRATAAPIAAGARAARCALLRALLNPKREEPTMKVETLMSKQITACNPADPLSTAARLMWERDVGFLPVIEPDGRLVGAITDRDVAMGAMLNGRNLSDLPVARAMSAWMVTCSRDTELKEAEEMMRQARVRRLPVIDDEGILQGVLSLTDLARAHDNPKHASELRGLDVVRTLARIGSPVGEVPPSAQVEERKPEERKPARRA
jgi:CBS domain-containing protein